MAGAGWAGEANGGEEALPFCLAASGTPGAGHVRRRHEHLGAPRADAFRPAHRCDRRSRRAGASRRPRRRDGAAHLVRRRPRGQRPHILGNGRGRTPRAWARQVVVTAGEPGRVENTYLIHVVDGRETGRELLSSQQIAAPVAEIRRVGTRTPSGSAEIEAIIRDAAAAQGADAGQLLRVAYCESRFNPSAYNASGASGLFQFLPSTWAANSVRAGYAGASAFDPVAAANVAAWMFARGQSGQWVCR